MKLTRKLKSGQIINLLQLKTLNSENINIPDGKNLIHLQFLRFAGCPYCNLHMHSFTKRKQEINDAGIKEILVFHSPKTALSPYQKQIPFTIIADPEKRLYREFGVESSWLSIFDPRSWIDGVKGILQNTFKINMNFKGGILGLPADFLIDPKGKIIASKYGKHASDQWTVDELLKLVKKK